MSRTENILELKKKTILNIVKVFKNRQYRLNYFINGYVIDLFFPEYNLAIHGINILDQYNNKTQVSIMNKNLRRGLSFRFIDFDVSDSAFNIFDLLGNIVTYMDAYERLSSIHMLATNKIENILKTNLSIMNEVQNIKHEIGALSLNTKYNIKK